MKKNRLAIFAGAVLVSVGIMFSGCLSTSDANGEDPAIAKGINSWNKKGPSTAKDYWEKIGDEKVRQQYLNYITLYDNGVAALDSTDAIKASQESKLLAACNTAIKNFSALDPDLDLTDEICEKGAAITAPRINKLLESERITDARKLYGSAKEVYGSYPELEVAGKEIDVVSSVISKRKTLKDEIAKVSAIQDVNERISAFQKLSDSLPAAKKEISNLAARSGTDSTSAVKAVIKSYNNVCQNLYSERKLAIREKAYEYKEQISDIFARQMEGRGSGKNGAFTNQEILNHYASVRNDMRLAYNQLLEFQQKYPEEIDANVMKDINSKKVVLESKIALVEREIAKEKEIASRGKYIGIIGLFNAEAKDPKKSKPAKFNGSTAKSEDYLWGIADIASGAMNDLVIKMRDNREVHVYNQNTKSGKQIAKLGLTDLISRQNKVGNSWPVMNAREALKGQIFYVQVEQGRTTEYAGEAVIYASFITRSR